MPTSSLPRVAILLVASLLAACQSPTDSDPSESLQPLAAAEIGQALVGNTLSRSGGSFWRQWDYVAVHRADGTMTGRVSFSGGEEVVSGVWEIAPDGLYCRTWENDWGGGKRGCFRASRGGESLVFDHVTGSSGGAGRYVYRLLSGNPHGL